MAQIPYRESMQTSLTRRELLKKAGHGLAAAGMVEMFAWNPLAASAAAQSPQSTARKRRPQAVAAPAPGRKLGWAIVGLGSLALGEILPAFAECKHSKPVALVSGHRDKAERVAQQYGIDSKNIYNYQNYETIGHNPEVDIIYIVLPNGMHAEYTIRGAQAGKHILCEKPMANAPKDCQAMIDACRKADRTLMIAYRCQYEPHNLAAIQLARSKQLGPMKAIIADHGFNIGDPSQWRLNKALAGGGSLMDIGIYSLQAARYIAGEEPTEINAMLYSTPGDPRFKQVEENVDFMLRFPSGILANCTSSYGYAGANRYRAIAADGWLELEPATAYRGLQMVVAQGGPPEERRLPETNQFAVEMDHMSQCILGNKPPHTPGEEGLRDITLIAAIYEAARTGKTIKVSSA